MKGHLLLQLCRARCMTRRGCSATMALFSDGRGVVVCPANSPQVCCPWSAQGQSQTPASAPSGVPARLRGPRARRPRHRSRDPSSGMMCPSSLSSRSPPSPPRQPCPCPSRRGRQRKRVVARGQRHLRPREPERRAQSYAPSLVFYARGLVECLEFA